MLVRLLIFPIQQEKFGSPERPIEKESSLRGVELLNSKFAFIAERSAFDSIKPLSPENLKRRRQAIFILKKKRIDSY